MTLDVLIFTDIDVWARTYVLSASARVERGVNMDPLPEDRAAAEKPDETAGTIQGKAGKIDSIETGVDACIERASLDL